MCRRTLVPVVIPVRSRSLGGYYDPKSSLAVPPQKLTRACKSHNNRVSPRSRWRMPLLLVSFLASMLAVTADDSSLLDQLIVSGNVANSFLTSGITLQSRRRQSCRLHRHCTSGVTGMCALGFLKLLTSPVIVVAERQRKGGNEHGELKEEIDEKWYYMQWEKWDEDEGGCRNRKGKGKEWEEEGACRHINEWDVSKVTSFKHLFNRGDKESKRSTIDVPSLNGWVTSRVKNMDSTFQYAQQFNGQISNWNVASVTNMKKSECPVTVTSSLSLFLVIVCI